MYSKLLVYKQLNGNVNVPFNFDFPYNEGDPKLGLWVADQRKSYKRNLLRQDRVQELESIGFLWDARPTNQRLGAPNDKQAQKNDRLDQQWMENYNQLVHYYHQNGKFFVSRYDEQNKGLNYWQSAQRQQYKRGLLRADRQHLLEQIGFTFDFDEQRWQERFEEAKRFKEEHGHFEASKDPDNQKLWKWIKHHRRLFREGKLNEEHRRQLDEIGFVYEEPSGAVKKRESTMKSNAKKAVNSRGRPPAAKRKTNADNAPSPPAAKKAKPVISAPISQRLVSGGTVMIRKKRDSKGWCDGKVAGYRSGIFEVQYNDGSLDYISDEEEIELAEAAYNLKHKVAQVIVLDEDYD